MCFSTLVFSHLLLVGLVVFWCFWLCGFARCTTKLNSGFFSPYLSYYYFFLRSLSAQSLMTCALIATVMLSSLPLSVDCQEHPVYANPVEPGSLPRSCAWHLLAAGTGYTAGTATTWYNTHVCTHSYQTNVHENFLLR